MKGLRHWAEALRKEVHALYLACRDPRTPWYAKAIGACVIGYALSPIDLIPDPIPVLGYLDDLILIPLGVLLVRRLIPAEVMRDCRARAEAAGGKPTNWIAGGIIILLWIAAGVGLGWWIWRRFR
jgi:uncharacterized membrane protein YkvA (DUF1232 family)